MTTRERLRRVRSILESPLLDEGKWAKVATLSADAVLLDLEDSVPPNRKREARQAAVRVLEQPGLLADRLLIARPNNIATPEGLDDLVMLAQARPEVIAYPKARTAAEIAEVEKILNLAGESVALLVIIETASAILELERIAAVPGVSGFIFGPFDLALDAGWSPFPGGEPFRDAYHYPKSRLRLVAAAYDLVSYDMMFVQNLKDDSAVEKAVQLAKAYGFTGMATFYPAHLDVINAAFTPSPEELAAAKRTCTTYEAAVEAGRAALKIEGLPMIRQDYERALQLIARANGAP